MSEPFISGKGISFRLFGFPVLYRWSALALPVFFGWPLFANARSALVALEGLLALAIAIGAAVLIHELGHAASARHFGGTARIELVFLGGLTHHSYPERLSNGKRAFVSLAGTLAGVGAALPVFLLFRSAVLDPSNVWEQALFFFVLAGGVWGIFNLVPLPGLDGSHVLDAAVRAVAPSKAAVIVPVVTGVMAVVAIIFMYQWSGPFGALWLLIIFGPELMATSTRIRQGRDEPLIEEAIEAEQAFRRGDLERAVTMAEAVIQRAGSKELVQPMTDIRRAALARLGRLDELLVLDEEDGRSMPPLMRARALASVGRLAEAEAEARGVLSLPEAGALVAELLVMQQVESGIDQVLTPQSISILNARIADLERVDPRIAARLAEIVLESAAPTPLDRELARMTLGAAPRGDELEPDQRWLVDAEWAVRQGDVTGFEHSMRSIPGPAMARLAQRRFHALARHDQAARLGSVITPDPSSRFLLARSFARLGHTDEAMTALETAVASGWSDAPETVTNPDLIGLHGHPGWRRLLERMASATTGPSS